MIDYAKRFSIAAVVGSLLLSVTVVNAAVPFKNRHTNSTTQTTSTNLFSPYADMTINTYWDSNYQDMEPMNLLTVSKSTGINSYHLAFITDSGMCNPAWGGQQSYSVSSGWGAHLTDNLRANSINYIISFGGASGNDISMSCSNTQLTQAFEQVISVYQPQGLDFDIENGTANIPKLMTVLKQIQLNHANLKISFTLPTMPEGLTAQGEDILEQAKTNGINYSVNIMAMDYGPAYTADMGQYAIQAATNLFNFLKTLYPDQSDSILWQKVEVTPMIGVNDVSVENFTLTNAQDLRDFAYKNNLGNVSMWSVARDQPCADQWASPTCSGNNLQSNPYDFSKCFLGEAGSMCTVQSN